MSLADDIRADFPFLKHNPEIIYFDNACMSLRPQVVLDAVFKYYEEMSACAGRSNHRLATKVAEAVEDSRKAVGKLINSKKTEEVVFVRNTSEAINLVANSLKLKSGDVVLTSDKEHNSNLVPWLKLRDEIGIKHEIVRSRNDNTFDMEAYEEALKSGVKLVALVQTSNLDGATFPIKEVVGKAHEAGALVLVDGAQSVPHKKIDVQDLDVDFLAFSGHKMMGPSGMGVLYGKYELLSGLEGFMVGGDTVVSTTYKSYELLQPPEKFEAGLQDYAGIMGLGAACEYLMEVGPENISSYEASLNEMLTEGVKDIEGLKVIGPADASKRGGVFSFTLGKANVHQVALMLDETAKIMVRSGQHCVHSWFNDRKIEGSVRVSLYAYNTEAEVAKFIEQLHSVALIV